MTYSCLKNVAVPMALATMLIAGGCKSNNQQANNPSQYPQQQGQPAPNQPQQQQPAPNQAGQQAMNPESTPTRQMQSEPPPARERRGYANDQQQGSGDRQQGYGNRQDAQRAYAPAPRREAATIPAGTHVVVTLGQEISSKTSQAGDSFSATVAEPVVVGGVTVIRAGAAASGTVVDAKSLGRFKGQAELAIRLDSVRAEGRSYQVSSSTVDRIEKGKGKRTAVLTGGGGGLGALIGGLAGGGKGALIGGLVGAGAGGTGSAFTGNHELVIPAETRLTFRLERDVNLR